jgi:purine nucleosidase
MALLLALASPELNVLGVTTVFGNSSVENTTRNAQHVLAVGGRADIPVVAGAGQPLSRPRRNKASVHGADGLGNIGVPPSSREATAWQNGAAGFLADTIMRQPGEVTLVAVAPLTNLAQAVEHAPSIIGAVKRVIVMGGAVFRAGNVTPVAEANFHNDPEAARIVMSAGWPVTLVGLDVTMRTIMSDAYLDDLARLHNPVTDFLARIWPVYRQAYHTRYALTGIPTHDPSAMAAAIDPTLFHTQRLPLYVEVEGRCAGQSVADPYRQWAPLPEVEVCTDVDSARLLALFRARMAA